SVQNSASTTETHNKKRESSQSDIPSGTLEDISTMLFREDMRPINPTKRSKLSLKGGSKSKPHHKNKNKEKARNGTNLETKEASRKKNGGAEMKAAQKIAKQKQQHKKAEAQTKNRERRERRKEVTKRAKERN
ncbi:hypothetical protein S245_001198, partial [Arachis hypogaea]